MNDNLKDLPTPKGYFVRAANKMAEKLHLFYLVQLEKNRSISSVGWDWGRGCGRERGCSCGQSGRFGCHGDRGGCSSRHFPEHLGGRPGDT